MSQSDTIKRLINNSAEIITESEFTQRLESKEKLTHYIGFEISGYVHIGQGIMSALVMKDLTDLGVKCTVWLADWHTWINEKLNNDKQAAADIGQGYFTEAIKASYASVGGNPDDIEFRLASEWYAKDAMKYFELEKQVEKNTTLSRMQRSISIAGRKEEEVIDFAKLTYPAMQVADIFYQGIDIAHSGMDQRKAHVVMRDVADKIQPGQPKPMALHHPLLIGLEPPSNPDILISGSKLTQEHRGEVTSEAKMSKSKPDSAIWIHDSTEDIERKIKKAFCPEREIHHNPILNWIDHILFWNRTKPFRIERKEEHGGDIEFMTYKDLETAYAEGEVHPMDLKAATAQELIDLLAPARDHFDQPEIAAKKSDLDKILEKK